MKKSLKSLEITDNSDLNETKENKKINFNAKKKKIRILLIILFFCLVFSILGGVFYYFYISYKDITSFSNPIVTFYDSEKDAIKIEASVSSNTVVCGFSNDKNIIGVTFSKPTDNKCTGEINKGSYYIFTKNKYGIVSSSLIDDFVVEVNTKDNYYLAVGGSDVVKYDVIEVGNPLVDFVSLDSSVVSVDKDKITGKKLGKTKINIVSNEIVLKEINVVVTDVITKVPKEFNNKKKYLPCNVFDKNEVKLLDTILVDRINDVGKNTRAAAVEAARFLTLEFPYRITYFFENGRIDISGVNYVDGEGRYYHEGLYLGKAKEKQIKYTYAGPAMWGCPLINYEDTYLFSYGVKYPNGLDCSGFVSWVLKNAGFDPGDIGAGNAYSDPRELTDLGEFVKLDNDIIYSDRIKVGDLINDWGHIAIIVGIDENNFYVAESLDIYGGVVTRTYPKKTITKPFSYVVLMDDYYKEDGLLTNMWY